MKRTVLLQEIRKMRFDEAYEGWDSGRLTQGQAAELPGIGLALQIPADRHRCHYVKVRVRVNRYPSGALAVFHGPRGLAYFTPQGLTITEEMQQVA
jgi:hypothetical protein